MDLGLLDWVLFDDFLPLDAMRYLLSKKTGPAPEGARPGLCNLPR
jgi:hypothetical protein